jgi:serine/threonine protein kinase
MEYIEGDTLDKYKLTLQLLTDCVVTLDKLHRHGIIHRDIKPDNIMCTDDSKVKFIDLGIACSSIYKKNILFCNDTEISGTKNYMDPQLFLTDGYQTNILSDI